MFARLRDSVQRFYPVIAFFAGFIWDALTIGQRVRVVDFWRLGGFLVGAAALIWWLAWRDYQAVPAPDSGASPGQRLRWQLPRLALPFFFGGIFSALFIFYVKSAGHLGTALGAAILGGLLVANEFWGQRYGQRFTLTWSLFALNAILLLNFVFPHAAGSLDPAWFYVSTGVGVGVCHGLWYLAPGRPGRIWPAWAVGLALVGAWHGDMVAPVPLVKRDLWVGQQFVQAGGQYRLQVESAEPWQVWRDQAGVVHVPEGGRLYAVAAIFAPYGVAAALEQRWERRQADGSWSVMARSRYQASGGREGGFRGYSWVLNPAPGEWRVTVGTQDGRTISNQSLRVERGEPDPQALMPRAL